MPRVGADIGSAEHALTQKVFLRYSFMPLATVAALTVMPTAEVTTATIGRLCQAAAAPTASVSLVALSIWATAAAGRTGVLFVASRNNKSLRQRDLEFHR